MTVQESITPAVKNEVILKTCSKCGKAKPATVEFWQGRTSSKDGFRSQCRSCLKIRNAEYHIKNREVAIKRATDYVKNNKEKVGEYQARYRESNKEYFQEYFKEYQSENKDKRNKRARERRKVDPKFRLNDIITSGIGKSLKNGKGGKSWTELVDFTIKELESKLKHSIPKGYKWQDFLDGKLHIDHILPKSKFNFNKATDPDFKECWSLGNLRLLPAIENIKKKDKLKKPMQMGLIFG